MPREPEERPVAEVVTSAPDADLTVVADADLVRTAVRTSEALFDSAQLVVVAGRAIPAPSCWARRPRSGWACRC